MKGCPGCGGKELTEHVSGITQEVHYDNGYIVREVTLYPKSYKDSYVSCDKCGKKFEGPYEL
jgi:hypothetical protein